MTFYITHMYVSELVIILNSLYFLYFSLLLFKVQVALIEALETMIKVKEISSYHFWVKQK